jgi:hypothetical protein
MTNPISELSNTSQTKDTTGQANRLARFEDVHGLKQSDFEAFLNNIAPFCKSDGSSFVILDGMGGYGDVSAHIIAEAKKTRCCTRNIYCG